MVRDNGHKRVPEPPDRITGTIRSVDINCSNPFRLLAHPERSRAAKTAQGRFLGAYGPPTKTSFTLADRAGGSGFELHSFRRRGRPNRPSGSYGTIVRRPRPQESLKTGRFSSMKF
jgi:hypothetical protein